MRGFVVEHVAQDAQQVHAATPRRDEVLDIIRDQRHPDAIVLPNRGEAEQSAQFRRQLALLLPARAEQHGTRDIDHEHHRELALLDEALDVGFAEPRGDVPIDVADLIPGNVGTDLFELDAATFEHALGATREQVLDQPPAADLEPTDLTQQILCLRRHQGTRTCSRMRRATSSPSTPSASAS